MLPRLKLGLNEKYFPIYLSEDDRFTHVLLLGKSGGGKSELLKGWFKDDHLYRNAKILIEPSGFLARECFAVAKGQALYCSLDTPVSINPMQVPYDPNTVSDLIAEAINQVVSLTTPNQSFTVRMRSLLDRAIKYCLQNNRKSLVNVRDWIVNLNEKGTSETRDGIIARLDFLLNDERMRPILCGNDSVKWGEFIEGRKTFILDCFGMSREKMIFTGTLISQGIKNYFRYERPKVYRPVSFYIDECHNFVNFNFMDILKEGRKYKLSCTLATQDFASIDDRLARVMLNVGALIAFRLGHREAQLLANEMGKIKEDEVEEVWSGNRSTEKITKFDTKEILQNLEKYHLAYMTPRGKGIGKAPRPPLIRKMEPKKAEPKKKEEGGWFRLEAYELPDVHPHGQF
jgi:hypothetical protein